MLNVNVLGAANSLASHSACGCHRQPTPPAGAPEAAAPTDTATLSDGQPPDGEQPAPPPQEPPSPNVKVNIYAQDPFVDGPITIDFERAKIGQNLSGERVRISDPGREKARPDENGNYLLAPGTVGISQVNAHFVTYATLDLFERYRGGKIDWAFGNTLEVVPHKQEGRNAYYSRWEESTNFFYFPSNSLNTTVKTANSADVVSHETGHAMLDGLRPGFFGTWDAETGAFHEAFGDCAAMLFNLEHASNRSLIGEQSGGSLRQHNALSSLAEEFGAGVKRDNDDPSDDHKTYLRTALNNFTYVPPSELPPGRGDEDNLGREVHSFSRLFSAAFYDCLEGLYMQSIYSDRQCPDQALKTAADVAGPLLVRAIETSPSNRATFRGLALGMINADRELNGGKHVDALKEVFLRRHIVSPSDFEEEAARLASLPDLQLNQKLDSGDAAVNFVKANADKLGLSADLPLEPEQVYTNARGEQFLTLNYSKEVAVEGVTGFDGYTTDVYGGVTLVFGQDGKLKEYHHTPITQEVVEEEMRGIAEMKGGNSILENPGGDDIFASAQGGLFKGVVQNKKLVRVPVATC